MNYYFLSLARKYKLIGDVAIEKWAYKYLEENDDPEWWFSYLISTSTLESVGTILRDAASESEVEETGSYCFKYESADSWCRFLSLINQHREFRTTFSEIIENAEHSSCLESELLCHTLNKLKKSNESDDANPSGLWIDLFQSKDLEYFESYIVPFFEEFKIDANLWLKSMIKFD